MHILVVNYEYPPIGGGGGVVARDFAEAWVASGHQVSVVTSRYGELKAFEQVNGVDVIRVPVVLRKKVQTASHLSMLSYVPSCILKCISSRTLRSVDIVNTHFAIPSGPAGQSIAHYCKVPNILSIHGGDIFDPSKSLSPHKTPMLSQIVTAMLKRADRVVAQSTDTRSNALTYYQSQREIDIIPLGIKKPVFTKLSRDDLKFTADDFVLCTVGRLVKRKNLEDLLEITAQLKNQINVKLVVIGDGPEKNHLETKTELLGIQQQVRFCGAVDDERKFQLLDCADLYVSTATHEGFGLVFLEAMECGLPVICYNRGGQRDFLIEDKTGHLVELGKKDLFKKQIIAMQKDKEKLSVQSTFCKSYIEDYYIENCAEKYIDLFKTVLESREK